MKRLVFLLFCAVILLPCSAVCQVDVKSFEFRGFRLGDILQTGMDLIVEDPTYNQELAHPDVWVYARSTEKLSVGDIPLERIEYYYAYGKLFRIVVSMPILEDPSGIIEAIERKFDIAMRERYDGFVFTGDRIRLELISESGGKHTDVIVAQTDAERKVAREVKTLSAAKRRMKFENMRTAMEDEYSAAPPRTTQKRIPKESLTQEQREREIQEALNDL